MSNFTYRVAGLFLTALLLAGCGSDSDGTSDSLSSMGLTTSSGSETDDNSDTLNGPEGEIAGNWVICNDQGGIRSEFTFTANTYSNSVGAGSCNGFDDDDNVLTNAGPFTVTGTAMSDTGQTAFVVERSLETINGNPVFQTLRETNHQLVYISAENQLFFSDIESVMDDLSLTLNFDLAYERF